MMSDYSPRGVPDAVGAQMPHDPARAGLVGKRRAKWQEIPVADGNRAERRAFERMQRREARKRH